MIMKATICMNSEFSSSDVATPVAAIVVSSGSCGFILPFWEVSLYTYIVINSLEIVIEFRVRFVIQTSSRERPIMRNRG